MQQCCSINAIKEGRIQRKSSSTPYAIVWHMGEGTSTVKGPSLCSASTIELASRTNTTSAFLRPPQNKRSFQGTLTLLRQPQPAKPKQNNSTAKPSRRSFCLHIGHHFDSGEQLTRPSGIYRVSAVTIGCRMESYAARLASFNAAHPTKKRASNASIGKTLKWPHKNPSPPQVRLGSQKRLIAQC